ncbi:four-carbon acid sugar kinase family protein [Actinopolymorpha pittospori]|uniref:Uncharacterized protein YgbK (DUF1537 family) n=1 Tax=Actinopolymorpha pittospori TaxID=648752 RepID=A0A927N4G8_9ACTN|nr:four-carbon acid sugar kinase family protein [Actinopolymorpha pittospori]MBE1608395.1 uncharacterized protein YgbK (DUF1537 family) [Actinopolymorpha pittospori]
MPRIGFYGDDFTGSVDALLQFRRAGLSGVLVTSNDVEIPTDDIDVVGIAGVARSLPTAAMAAEVVPALRRLLDLEPIVVQYKACSTADSSATVGSLGRAIELSRKLFPAAPVPVLFAQPDFGRYTFFSHHFARDGDLIHRLDRQPTMVSHPVTPATESDLRRHLASQTTAAISALHWPTIADAQRLEAALDSGAETVVVCDAFTNEQIDRVAAAILAGPHQPRFVLGSGGLSGGLGRAMDVPHRLPPPACDPTPAAGPTLVLNGSRSAGTRGQVEAAARAGWPTLDLFAPATPQRAARLHAAGSDLVVDAAATPRSGPSISQAVEVGLADLADTCLRRNPATRLVVCGGDTSGKVLRRLGVERLTVVGQPWGNVALCEASGAAPHVRRVELVLKGGQMGHLDLFDDVRQGRRYEPSDVSGHSPHRLIPDSSRERPGCSPTPPPARTPR